MFLLCCCYIKHSIKWNKINVFRDPISLHTRKIQSMQNGDKKESMPSGPDITPRVKPVMNGAGIVQKKPNKSTTAFIPPENAIHQSGWSFWEAALLPSIITFLVYLPVLKNGFVNWDDPYVILKNAPIRSLGPSSIRWMFTTFYLGNWIPLNWFSLSLDYQWGGQNPVIYHLHNLILHLLSTLLVFSLGFRLFLLAGQSESSPSAERPAAWAQPAAFLAALLFGLHPIHVESVAWATERKDVLCGLFFLSSLLIYLRYACDPDRKAWKLYACLGLFLMALLSKPMAVTLPVVLLLLDLWPLRRFTSERARVLTEKIPFYIAALFSGWLALLAQSHAKALWTIEKLPLDLRVMNAFHSLAFYLTKIAAPFHLAAFYPIPPGHEVFSAINMASLFLVVLISLSCFYFHKKRPYITVTWLYYVITLIPVLGLLQVGGQAAADRYTYLPSLGPFLLVSGALSIFFTNRRWVFTLLLIAFVIALGMGTVLQIQTWKDSATLWENILKNDQSALACSNLGDAYWAVGRKDDALLEYDRAIALDASYANPHDGKGIIFSKAGQLEEAIREFNTAITLDPNDAVAHGGKGTAFLKAGQLDQAALEFRTAIGLDPREAEAHYNLGVIYVQKGMLKEALEETLEGIRTDPTIVYAYGNLGRIYMGLGKFAEAAEAFKNALALDPGNQMYIKDLAFANQRANSPPQ